MKLYNEEEVTQMLDELFQEMGGYKLSADQRLKYRKWKQDKFQETTITINFRTLLYEYLLDEYSTEDATKQSQEAQIEVVGDELVKVTYDNGAFEHVRIVLVAGTTYKLKQVI